VEEDGEDPSSSLSESTSSAAGGGSIAVDITAEIITRFRAGIAHLVKDRKYHFHVYPKCFIGRDACNWMVKSGMAKTVEEAERLGNEIMKRFKSCDVLFNDFFKGGFFSCCWRSYIQE